jgi:hypothetical protein
MFNFAVLLFQRCRFCRSIGFFCAFLLAGLVASSAWAGGGPENVFLVVNPKSESSMAIANCYIRLRQIPPGNVFYLPWDPESTGVEVEDFRKQILKPILEAIQSRRLVSQIDYVIYSSGFPCTVLLDADINKFKNASIGFKVIEFASKSNPKAATAPAAKEWKTAPTSAKMIGVSPECTPKGSLNGMTYLWPWVLQGSPDYLAWQNNRYMRQPIEEQKDKPSLGFRSSWQFDPTGKLVDKDGASYMLSTVLGVTVGRGNTVPEVLKYLEQSVLADGKHPRGTIYFMQNEDVRSTVRDGTFPETVKALEKLGIDAKIVKGTIPLDRRDVQGVCMGTDTFNWKASGSTIQPGALCEHFTSYGGMLEKGAGQTCLTEFLKYGAAGASGTVIEPYAVWQKFPLPQVQVHYGRGCTLAEAFYQSVFGPYQLLIVGDPLCRPWANIPKVEVKGIKNDDVCKGDLVITPSATLANEELSIDRFELFVNGARAAQCKPGETLKLDTTLLPDGSQEIRVVAVENSMIQSQGRAIFRVFTENYGRKIEVHEVPVDIQKRGEKLKIDVKSPGSIGIAIMQNSRLAGRIAGEKGTVEIPTDELGGGRAKLQAVGIGSSGPKSNVLSVPFEVEVEQIK